MNRSRRTWLSSALAGILPLALFCLPAHGQQRPAQPGGDAVLERKKVIEAPAKALLVRAADTPVYPANPAVEPGKVRWHPDFEAACQAARASGKPVLLFQMLGRLDQQFC